MIEDVRDQLVRDAVLELLGVSGNEVRAATVPDLDVSQPNIHSIKKQFLRELRAVEVA